MAKLERTLYNMDFDAVLDLLEEGILSESVSAALEEQTDWQADGVRCAVRVYERYSVLGQNRVSLSVTLLGLPGEVLVSAIASGGSQAVLFKLNTFGESAFLESVERALQGL